MFDHDIDFEDPLSAMAYGCFTMSFVVAHSLASIWVTAHGKNTMFEALHKDGESPTQIPCDRLSGLGQSEPAPDKFRTAA